MFEERLIDLVKKAGKEKNEITTLEFKAAKKGTPLSLYDTLSSFSNTEGGVILFGIDEKDNYAICGVGDPERLIKDVGDQCDEMEPKVRPLFSQATIDGKIIVSAEIPEIDYLNKPCFYKGKGKAKGSYVRVGEKDEPMGDYEIYNYEAYKRKIDEELRVDPKVLSQDIDEHLLRGFVDKLLSLKPNLRYMREEDVLRSNGLLAEGKPTLCSLLNFGKVPQMISPMLDIVCSIPATDAYGVADKNGVRFLSSPRIDGTLSDMADGAISFVMNNSRTKIIVGKDGKRHDEPDYPEIAVREAILNALVHRDYSIYTENCPITVTLFSDRLEIVNPGCLYGRMTLEELGKKNADTRNPFIAFVLEVLRGTENRFSGIPTMREAMAEAGQLPPLFENLRDSFKVTLFKGKLTDRYQKGFSEDDIVDFCKKPRSKAELAKHFGFDEHRPAFFFSVYIEPIIAKNRLRLTIPNRPKSKNQQVIAC
jgi:ATP-dependent DNA helicase RecG